MATRSPHQASLAESSRRAILEQLTTGPKTVNELVQLTGLSQPNVSNHLGRLRSSNAVRVTKSGRTRVYELAGGIPPAALLATALPVTREPLTVTELKEQSERLFSALIEGDQRLSWKVVHECVRREPSVAPLYSEVVEPALRKVGDWYQRGRITEAEEHLATSLAERLMAYAANSVPVPAWNGRKAVLGAVAGNHHVVGLRMLADSMEQRGWAVRYVGANVPTESFVKMVRAERPDLVLVSASLLEHAAEVIRLGRQLEALRTEGVPFQWALGGTALQADPSLARDAGADFTARDLKEFLKALDKIPSS